MRPVIAITGSNNTDASGNRLTELMRVYSDAVYCGGGLPMLVFKPDAQYADIADGLLLSGGVDIAPERFGEEKLNDTVSLDKERDELEFPLLDAFVKAGKPVFAICRGVQVINVAFGGTLYQDLPQQKSVSHSRGIHDVKVFEGTELYRLFGERIKVNTYHHQAIKDVAKGFVVTSENGGIIEGIEHETLPISGVQWHPERMIGRDPADKGTDDMTKLFANFIEKAGGSRYR